nr:reverse transcriptase domain-containing protein [Tanacetum cinerariifolium]
MGVKNLQENMDSRLLANQVNGTYIAKEADMIRFLEKVRTLTNGFRTFSIKQVPISENKKADALSKIASTSFTHLSKQVLVEELKEKSINELEVLAVVEEEGNTWMTLIYEYLTEETLPVEVNKARVGTDKGMPRLPGSHTYPKKSAAKVDPNHISMAIIQVRNRQSRTFLGGSCLREGIKARLDARNKNWMEEISHVLWAHRTTIKSSNGDSPFSLTYGTEAVIPAEIGMPILRTTKVDMD